jgi:hypothetical protein
LILYADTSALIKRYIKESGSEQVLAFFSQHAMIGTSVLTQVEMASAMSKAVRQNWAPETEIQTAWKDFLTHWPYYISIPISPDILDRGVALAWRYGLRAYDVLHLATVLSWENLAAAKAVFACYDKNLNNAARQEGLHVWPMVADS